MSTPAESRILAALIAWIAVALAAFALIVWIVTGHLPWFALAASGVLVWVSAILKEEGDDE
jgi:hypothetical protein